MKRILSVLTALALALIACVAAFAADENVIALEPESLIGRTDYFATAEQLTFEDGSVTADNVEIFAFKLPKNVALGETVTVHIKGSSDGDFRSWLICADETANKGDHATFSKMWKASENGYTPGTEFDLTYSLTASDEEPVGGTEANKLCFKAFAAHETLDNLKLTYVSVTYDTETDIAAESERLIGVMQPDVDAINAALAEAQASPDDYDAVKAAYDKATAAMESIETGEAGKAGYADVVTAVDAARETLSEIEELYNAVSEGVESAKILEDLQSYIDTIDSAVETAKNAGSDVSAAEQALADADAAYDYIVKAANDSANSEANRAAREAKAKLQEINDAIETSKQLKQEEESAAAAAAEEAAAKKATQKKVLIIVAIVVAVAVVVGVVAGVIASKKKKK